MYDSRCKYFSQSINHKHLQTASETPRSRRMVIIIIIISTFIIEVVIRNFHIHIITVHCYLYYKQKFNSVIYWKQVRLSVCCSSVVFIAAWKDRFSADRANVLQREVIAAHTVPRCWSVELLLQLLPRLFRPRFRIVSQDWRLPYANASDGQEIVSLIFVLGRPTYFEGILFCCGSLFALPDV